MLDHVIILVHIELSIGTLNMPKHLVKEHTNYMLYLIYDCCVS